MHHSTLVVVLISVILCPNSSFGAPRSKSQSRDKPSSTTYDQKQTGEYNIQLHLKDFQIIAVVGEDSLGMGDYDYNYDYSEFTVRPQGTNSTTPKPTDFDTISILANLTSSQQINQNITQTTTKKPFMHQQHFSTTTKKSIKTTTKPPNPTTLKSSSATANVSVQTSDDTSIGSNGKPLTTPVAPSTTAKPVQVEISSLANVSSDKIPVAIQDGYNLEAIDEFVASSNSRKHDEVKYATNNELVQRPSHVTNVAIVPPEELGSVFEDELGGSDQVTLGEIMQYRRCAVGYVRDKRGRCRKIRRPAAGINQAPQLSLGITRFASNLAARFRQATSSPTDTNLNQQQDYSSAESNEPRVIAITH